MTALGTALIVDDHQLIAASLACALGHAGFDAHAVPVVDTGGIRAQAQRYEPGVVLLDLDLGVTPDGQELDGVDLVTPLRSQGWSVLVVTGTTDLDRVAAAVAAGAGSWIVKGAGLEELVRATVDMATGRGGLTEPERRGMLQRHRAAQQAAGESAERLATLTGKEREVLQRLTVGASAAEIAEETYTSIRTVRAHIRNILAKLDVKSQGAATAIARRHRRAAGSISAAVWRRMRAPGAGPVDLRGPLAQR